MSSDLDPRWNGVFIEESQFHFHRRLLERWGVVLGPGDYSGMRRAIRKKQASYVRTTLRGGRVYAVRVPSTGVPVMVVVANGWRFCTAYPQQKRYMRRHPNMFPEVD
ncbi:hypothetical protein ACFSCV_15795 [Methylopila henanensis]|uniref:DUF4258 domain-containing protein n=1 Tax=Methylopila henanensis TaxID=873516 RepID=A0ABW4KCP3_9HYPH